MKASQDDWLTMLAALASPQRLLIIAALHRNGRSYVSELARELEMSRPLLHLHLQKLEDAGLVSGTLELSDTGKALKYFTLVPFDYRLNAETLSSLIKPASSNSSQ